MTHPLLAFLQPILAPRMVIWADQNADRPVKPYWTLKVRQIDTAPLVAHPVDADGAATYTEQTTLHVELQCFGMEAVALAEDAARRMRLPSQAARAEALGISLARVDQARDLTALLSASQYEQRALVEFTAYAIGAATDQVGLIEHVILECPGEPAHQHVISTPDAATPPPS